jgi:DNA invertase Pin-like site-specific DNA recombinase
VKAVLYAAKSTEDKHGSIPTQLDDCSALAQREGWVVVGTFSDEAFSAYSGNTGPGLEQAKALAASTAAVEGVCILAAQDADRFARGAGDAPGAAEHLGEVYFQMKRQRVELWTVRSGQLDLLRAAFEGERSHDESARKSQATRAGKKRSAQKGRANGGRRPFGYRYSDDRNEPGLLVVVPHEAEIVRRMFSEYASGRNLVDIARRLHEDGVPTVTGGKSRWRQSTVGQLLKNPVYIGLVTRSGETYEGSQDAIVPEPLWAKVQAVFASRPSRGRGRPTKGQHLFRKGLLRCGRCGDGFVPTTDHGHEYYFCLGRNTMGKEFCDMPYIKRADIDTAVYRYFEKAALDVEGTRRQLADVQHSKLAELRSLTHSAETAVRESEAALERIKRDYLRGALSAEDHNQYKLEREQELSGAVGELGRLREQMAEVQSQGILRDAEQDTLEKLSSIRAAIAGEVRDAEGVAAVRVSLSRLFEAFIVYLDDGEGRIEPVVGTDAWTAVDGPDGLPLPTLRPAVLELGPENNKRS